MKGFTLSASAAAIACAGLSPAFAQEAEQQAAEEQGLAEIVVTAQRRTERLQDVPVSATALDAAALEQNAVATLSDLQTATPSLSITDNGITQNVNIRGIGLASDSPNVTAGVATYVDGLFQPPIVQANSFYDLASVEVLRGPQGTLVGSNSTGGAIFINSRNPDLGELGGYGEVAYGNYDMVAAEGAVNLPIAETVALRVAGFYRRRDSFYEDVGPFDNDAGELDEKGARATLLWEPGSFRAIAKVHINDRQTGGYAYRPIPGTTFAPFRVGDIRTLSFDEPTANRDRAFMTSLELRQELSSGIVLRSLTGYQYKRINNLYDVDASQAPLAAGGDVSQDYFAGERQYSQEINIISPTDGRFDWILGAYFQRNDIKVRIYELQGAFPTDITPDNQRTTTGIFAQGNYQLTPQLEAQLGARYSAYEATGTGSVTIGRGIPGFPPSGLVVADLTGSHEDARVTGKAALNWKPDEDNLLYALVARGYKPGGFNSATSEFDPEIVWSYEVGWKSSFLGRRLRTQISGFYNRYSNFQFNVVEPTTGFSGVENISTVTIKGIEAQVQGRFGGFGFDASIAYLDSELGSITFVNTRNLPPGTLGPQCPPGTPSSPPVCFDYNPFLQTIDGQPNLYAPEWTYNVGVDYEFDLGSATLTPRLNFSYVGPQFTYLGFSPVTDRIEGRHLLSALLTYRRDRWRVELFGTNLTNERYVSGQFGSNEFYGAPREYGVRLGLTF
ncbi:TonB-dependent receptor [Sphingosinicella sp. CPCC 101087]|uniref:TonB-dependent receptor n=1 Tax=Sphingosinicella sp. CPCC 101087 TaxID=2497754 RepID=UPI00101BA482|nr:TonB-dependent receptor [Sphingosinicella sp. CPCC 101087]